MIYKKQGRYLDDLKAVAEIMTELMWYTIGFVATLAIITIADSIMKYAALRK